MSPKPQKRSRSRGVVDTSVLAAGIAGFKRDVDPVNHSAILLRKWVENNTFTWLMTADILEEYVAVLARLRVRPTVQCRQRAARRSPNAAYLGDRLSRSRKAYEDRIVAMLSDECRR